MVKPEDMYQCRNCGCLYDPDRRNGKGEVSQQTSFVDLPENWCCPVCGATKKSFKPCFGPGSLKKGPG